MMILLQIVFNSIVQVLVLGIQDLAGLLEVGELWWVVQQDKEYVESRQELKKVKAAEMTLLWMTSGLNAVQYLIYQVSVAHFLLTRNKRNGPKAPQWLQKNTEYFQ